MRIKYRLLLLLVMLTCGITAAWAQQHVTVSPTTGGTVTVGTETPAAGSTVTITVTPEAGYQIAKSDIEVVATIDPGNAQAPIINATGPNVGYKIELQGDDPANLKETRTYTFTMPEAPLCVLITAHFMGVLEYNISISPDIVNGTVTSDKDKASYQETVILTVAPAAGYELETLNVTWIEGGTQNAIPATFAGNGMYTFKMPAHDVTIMATFTKKPYNITVDDGIEHGSVTVPATAYFGDQVTVTATPNVGYEVASLKATWYEYGTSETSVDLIPAGNGSYTFEMPAYNVTIEATFTKKPYNITVAEGIEHGSVEVPATATACMGDQVTLTVAPAAGYEVATLQATWIVGGTQNAITPTPIGGGLYTFEMPAHDVTIEATFTKKLYNITVVEGLDHGSISAPPTAYFGDEINVTVNPEKGYELDKITYRYLYSDGSTSDAFFTADGQTFIMPASDIVLTATFKLKKYNVEVEEAIDGDHGFVQAVPSTCSMGETVTLITSADTGYAITTLQATYEEGTTEVNIPLTPAENDSYTFVMPAADVHVHWIVSKAQYTITVNPSEHGTVTAPPTAEYGQEVTLTVTPDAHYMLESLSVAYTNGNPVTVTDNKFTMPAANVVVNATFKPVTYNITVAPTEHGTVTAPESAAYGSEVTVSVAPEEAYELETLTYTVEGGQSVPIENGKFTMPGGNVTITATFKPATYTITVAPTEHGTVTAPESAAYGTEVNVTVAPDPGYEIDELYYTYDAGGSVPDPIFRIENGKFVMPGTNVTIVATFKAQVFNIATSVYPGDEAGTITVASSAAFGSEVEVTATPAAGYTLKQLYYTYDVGGSVPDPIFEIENGKFTMPGTDITVVAKFEQVTKYNITVLESENGSVAADKTAAAEGEKVTLTITPAEGYELESLTVMNGETAVEVAADNTFTMPAGNVVVSATFRKIPVTTYTITVNPSDNGTVTPSKTEAAEGDVITLTVTPAEGYELETLTVMMGETPVTVTADNTFTMPAGDVVVSATFKEIVHTYNVVGEPAELFGTGEAWDPVSSDANMTLGADGNYTWTSQPTYLNGETVQFKVVQDRSWDSGCYPEGDNVKIEGLKPGTYTVTVTFNPETGEVTYTVDGQADVYVWGIFDGTVAANEGVKMTSEDGKIYTASITVSDFNAGYSFFAMSHTLGTNANDWTTLNAHRFMAESEGDFLVSGPMMNKELGLVYKNDASMKIPAGEYTLTLDLENMKLTITGGTQLSYILESGVEGVDYTVINDLVVVEKHDGTAQFFTSDGNNNWITLKGGDFYADAALIEAMKGGHVSGVFSDKNLNPYLTLTVAPEEAEDATAIEPEVYSLADAFSPKVDEVITVSKAYYKASENTLRAYAPGPTQGQSLTVDTSLFDYNFKDGRQYTVLGVINIKEPWNAKVDGIAPQDYNYPFQNYKLLVLDVTEHPASTAIDDILAEQGVKSVRYFNAAGLESNVPFPGVNIIVKEMNDGSKVTTKAIVK